MRPIVATVSTRREDFAKRRITSTSVRAPTATPLRTPSTITTGYGHSQRRKSRTQVRPVAAPMAPKAKLMTLFAR